MGLLQGTFGFNPLSWGFQLCSTERKPRKLPLVEWFLSRFSLLKCLSLCICSSDFIFTIGMKLGGRCQFWLKWIDQSKHYNVCLYSAFFNSVSVYVCFSIMSHLLVHCFALRMCKFPENQTAVYVHKKVGHIQKLETYLGLLSFEMLQVVKQLKQEFPLNPPIR